MKKLYYCLALLTVFACDKEIEIISVFDFEMEHFYSPNATINVPQNIDFTLTPEKVVSGTTYFFKYGLTAGTGHFLDAEGEMITENEWVQVAGTTFNLDYVGTTAESHEVNIFIRESSGTYEKEDTLTFQVDNTEFTFSATATDTNVNVNIPIPINFNLNQIGEGTVQHSMLFATTHEGTLTYDGVIYAAGEPIPLAIGASSGSYIGTVGGDHEVTFTVTNDNTPPIEHSDMVTMTINDYLFELTGFPEANSIFQGQAIDLNFDVDETEGNSPSYEMRYVITIGNATITDDMGSPLNENDYYSITDAINGFNWQLQSNTVGDINITFYIRNHIQKEESIAFNIEVVEASDFEIVTDFTEHLQNVTVVGGMSGNRCRRKFSSDVTFTVTSTGIGAQLILVSLTHVGSGDVLDNTGHILNVGESLDYTDTTGNMAIALFWDNVIEDNWEELLIDGEEYEIHFNNPTSGEDIIKTFFAYDAPDDENLNNLCTFYD